jgi:hypothetical protein
MSWAMNHRRNRAVLPMPPIRVLARPGGLAGFDVPAWGGHGRFPGPLARETSGLRLSATRLGLERSEPKTVKSWAGAAAFGKADSLTKVWIGVPFAVVFVMGCLTLA